MNTPILRCSYLTAEYLNAFMSKSPMKGLGQVLIAAEAETDIGADILFSIAWHESGHGTHHWSGPPYNNITNWGISAKGPDSEAKFASMSDCILKTAQYIKDRFMNPKNWRYQKIVKAELNPLSLEGIGFIYASDREWAHGVLACRSDLMAKAPESSKMKQYMGAILDRPVNWPEVERTCWIVYKNDMANKRGENR